jgi:exosortase/archaeosortase family protein
LAVLYAYFTEQRTLRRVLLSLSSVPIAIVANGLRVAGTGIAANFIGAAGATGFLHFFSGSMVFVASVALLFAVSGLLHSATPSLGSTGALS